MNTFVVFSISIFFLMNCGSNLFSSLVSDESDTARMVQAQKHLDKRQYSEATTELEKITQDSNMKRILLVSADMGTNELDIWAIVKEILDNSNTSGGSGIDNVFETIGSTILGDDPVTRSNRILAIESNIALLDQSPDQNDTTAKNLSCFLAGVLALPTVSDSTSVLTNAQSVLDEIAGTTTGGGTDTETCPDLSTLNSTLSDMRRIKDSFTAIIASAKKCNILDIEDTADSLNAVERQLNSLISNADKGCQSIPSCSGGAYCDALSLGCVQTALEGNETAIANDGIIATCELVQNCINPTACFPN